MISNEDKGKWRWRTESNKTSLENEDETVIIKYVYTYIKRETVLSSYHCWRTYETLPANIVGCLCNQTPLITKQSSSSVSLCAVVPFWNKAPLLNVYAFTVPLILIPFHLSSSTLLQAYIQFYFTSSYYSYDVFFSSLFLQTNQHMLARNYKDKCKVLKIAHL